MPEACRTTPSPTIGQRKVTEHSSKWRSQIRRVVDECGLKPREVFNALASVSEEHRKRFHNVLIGFGQYKPEGRAPLWVNADIYLPKRWLDE
jgi:hypothetical protein